MWNSISFYTHTCILINLSLTCEFITVLLHSHSNGSFSFLYFTFLILIFVNLMCCLQNDLLVVGLSTPCIFNHCSRTLVSFLCREPSFMLAPNCISVATLTNAINLCPYFKNPHLIYGCTLHICPYLL
jgi:hypothetical protein